MIRVGFLCLFSKQWIGGVNYLKNLLYAISLIPEPKIKPVIFVGRNIDPDVLKLLKPYAEVVHTGYMDLKSPTYLAWKVGQEYFNSNLGIIPLLKKYRIDVVSHSNLFGRTKGYKVINWIPDFQFLHLPQMYSPEILKEVKTLYRRLAKDGDRVIVSSEDALRDYNNLYPSEEAKVRVLHFVSQLPHINRDKLTSDYIRNKYKIERRFIYLPNQFWKHKNHQVVFEAIKILKDKKIDVLLVCSGHLEDNRNKEHIQQLKSYISENGLENNIRLLGLIDYDDVYVLLKFSEFVINPSLFEGWSTTVEESKSIEKKILLSDIKVHREQNPAGGIYFDPQDAQQLAKLIEQKFNTDRNFPDIRYEHIGNFSLLKEKSKVFAYNYQDIVMNLFDHHQLII